MKFDQGAYLRETGNVCHQWSYLEYLLSHVIWHMLKLNKEIGMIVTSGKDISSKSKMAHSLSTALKVDAELIDILEKTYKEIERLSPARNRVVHGVFSSHPQAVNPKVEIHRGKKAGHREDLVLTEIRNLGTSIHSLSMSLATVLEKYNINTH